VTPVRAGYARKVRASFALYGGPFANQTPRQDCRPRRGWVSIEYYSKLERGALAGVSASVLDTILALPPRLESENRSGQLPMGRLDLPGA
jgi:hypothetical protein